MTWKRVQMGGGAFQTRTFALAILEGWRGTIASLLDPVARDSYATALGASDRSVPRMGMAPPATENTSVVPLWSSQRMGGQMRDPARRPATYLRAPTRAAKDGPAAHCFDTRIQTNGSASAPLAWERPPKGRRAVDRGRTVAASWTVYATNVAPIVMTGPMKQAEVPAPVAHDAPGSALSFPPRSWPTASVSPCVTRGWTTQQPVG